MDKMTRRYASALLEYARENNLLEEIYRQALPLAAERPDREVIPISQELSAFLRFILESDVQPIMRSFVELAREELGILDVEIISAVPLTPLQIARVEEKLILMSGKQVDIATTIDPDIIGGLRIIAGQTVIDNSVKSQLYRMKERLYEGVYFAQ